MRKRLKVTLFAASLLSTTALAAAVYHVAARDAVIAAIARIPGAEVAAVHANPWTGQVEIDGLSVRQGADRIAIGKLDFAAFRPLPGLISEAFAADGTASAEDIVVDAGLFKITLDKITATGTSMTDAGLVDLFSTGSATSIADRIANLNATKIVVPTLTEDFAAPGLSSKFVYQNLELDNVQNGKIAQATASGGTLTASDPTNHAMSGTIGAMQVGNLDLAQIIHVFGEPRTDPNEALKPLYGNVSIDSMSISEPSGPDNVTVSIGKMTGQGFEGRPLTVSFADVGKLLSGLNGTTQPTPAQTKALMAFVTDIFSSFSVGAMDINDMKTGVTGDTPANFAVGHIGFAGMGGGKIDQISYDNVVFGSPDVKATIGNFGLRGLDFSASLAALAKLAAQGPPDFDDIDPRAFVPTLGQITFSGLDFDVPDKNMQGNAENGARDQFKLDKFEIGLSNYLNGIPTAVVSTLDHFTMPLPTSDQFKSLIDLGYSTMDLSSKLDIAWNKSAQELVLNELSATETGMGSVKLQSTLGNVTEDVFSSDTASMEAAALGILWKSMDLSVVNDGIFDKLLSYQAKQENKTVDEVRSDLIATAGMGIPAALGNGAAAKAIADAVTKFIANPKNLEISATSADGLGMADMQNANDPGALLDKLDVKATADQ